MHSGSRATVALTLNGQAAAGSAESRTLLSDFLRHELGLTGTHVGCEHGVCGACTVLVDEVPVRSCLMFAIQAGGRSVTTVEGLAGDGLHPLQLAFMEHHGLQCGFCTPGMLISALDLLRRRPDPDERSVREGLSGNLCRCTGYEGIVAAVLSAARTMATSKTGDPSTSNENSKGGLKCQTKEMLIEDRSSIA